MEAMSVLGFEFVDMSVTTTKGAVLVTSCVEVRNKTKNKHLKQSFC